MALTFSKFAVSPDKPIHRRIMLYGLTGSGKTHLAGTAQDVPDLAPIAAGVLDGGAATLNSRADIMGTQLAGMKEAEELLWMLKKRDPAVKDVRTLLLDGTTKMARDDLAAIAEAAAAQPPSGNRKPRDRDMNEQLDYKKNAARVLRVINTACSIPDITLIMTAWAKLEYPVNEAGIPDTAARPIRITPALSNAVQLNGLGLFDDVFYIEKLGDKRVLYTSEYKGIFAKTRDVAVADALTTEVEGKRMPYLVNPTFSDIYSRMKRAYKLDK